MVPQFVPYFGPLLGPLGPFRAGSVVYHNWSIYGGGNFFFVEPGVKLDEKSIENGLEGEKFLVVCLFWVVGTTLLIWTYAGLRLRCNVI